MRPGCCFLICPSREEADKAVAAYHNKRTLPGVWHSLPNIFPHLLSFHGDRLVEDLCFGFCLVLNEVILSASQASSPMQVKYADGELERLATRRVQVCLWLLSGQTQRRKGKLEERKKLNLRPPALLMVIQCRSHQYLVLYQWAIFLRTMGMGIRWDTFISFMLD
ncbi:hypothetical protein BHE74_00030259 [Ensete ventricosum]|nr:hypothetical protein GW17_00029074 [Ensete ventricosum]RWW62606.1 hypothetical protein BHE74_00030259 [Ensete ventricosum]